MSAHHPAQIPLPKSWTEHVRSAVLHVLSLAQFAAAYTRGWAANSINSRIRCKAELERANQEIPLLREEIRIKDACMARISPHRRPHYPLAERLAILELKAARGWSLEQTARVFQVKAATIASWTKRVDEEGSDALVQMRVPVNKFPDFVRYVVQRLRVLCPSMGKVKMAQTLARAGLHVGATTIVRMLKDKPAPTPKPVDEAKTADRVGHVQVSKSRLAGRSHTCANGNRPLVLVASVCLAAAVALLSLGSAGHGSCFSPRDGRGPLRRPAQLQECLRSLGASDPTRRHRPQVHRLRPRQHL